MNVRSLLLSAWLPLAAFAQPALVAGPERPVSKPILGPFAKAGNVDIASNGDLMLAVWTDNRSESSEVFAARLTSDGTVLDPAGIAITNTPDSLEQLANVAWDGSRFLVGWNDGLNSTWIAAVNVDGEVTPPVRASTNSAAPDFAVNGSRTLTLVNPAQGLGQLFLTLNFVGDDLSLTRTATMDDLSFPVIAPLGDGFVIATLQSIDGLSYVRVQLVDADGKPKGEPYVLEDLGGIKNGFTPVMAASGSDVLIGIGDTEHVAVARLHPDGTAATIADLHGSVFAIRPVDLAVRSDGSFDLIGYSSAGGSRAYRFDAAGNFLALSPGPPDAIVESVAVSRNRVFATWFLENNAVGAFLYGDQPVVRISSAPPSQAGAALATDGHSILTAWREDRGKQWGLYRIMARRGDAEPVAIGEIANPGSRGVAAAHDDHGWLVAWNDSAGAPTNLTQRLLLRRIADDGTLGETIVLTDRANPSYEPAFASDGAHALLAWPYGSGFDPLVRLFFIEGDDVRESLVPALGVPGVTTDGTRFLVVARDEDRNIVGTFVDAAGAQSPLFLISTPPLGEGDSQPAAAWNGERYLVTFLRHRDLYGQLLDRNGVALGGTFLIAAAAMNTSFVIHPAVVWDGATFVAAWNGTAMRVTSGGTPLQPLSFAADGFNPALLPLGHGASLLAYEHHDPAQHGVRRVFTRVLAPPRMRSTRH